MIRRVTDLQAESGSWFFTVKSFEEADAHLGQESEGLHAEQKLTKNRRKHSRPDLVKELNLQQTLPGGSENHERTLFLRRFFQAIFP